MVGKDGWCKHFDKATRKCMIYSTRPDFCRASSLGAIFSVPENDVNDYSIACCRSHIEFIYGKESNVMISFNDSLTSEKD